MSQQIKRWNHSASFEHSFDCDAAMHTSAEGQYVTYADHLAALRACEERMCKEFAMAYYLPKRVAMTNEEIAGRIMVRALRMTWEEQDALYGAWVSIPWRDRDAAVIGACVGGYASDGAVVGAFTLAVDYVSSFASTDIGAALAVLARDSRSESGPFTFDHYEILTRAWRQVIGAVHPDDDLPTSENVAK